MNEEQILDAIKDIAEERLGIKPNEIHKESHIRDDLALDSLDLMDLIVSLEKEFNIGIPDETTDKIVIIGDLVYYIRDNT